MQSNPNPKNNQRPNVKIHKDLIFLAAILAILLSVAIAAAMALPSERSVVSRGTLVSANLNQTLQHKRPGNIAKIHVAEGELVQSGQILVTLIDQENEARERLTRSQALSSALEIERIKALLSGKTPKYLDIPLDHWASMDDSEIGVRMDKVETEFRDTLRAHSAYLSAIDQKLNNAQKRIVHINKSKENRTARHNQQNEKVEAAKNLFDKGFLPKSKVQERVSALLVIEGEIAAYDEQLGIQESAIDQAKKERVAYETERAMNLNRSLRDVETKYVSTLENLRLNEIRSEGLQIKSPSAGTVIDLKLTHIGQAVSSGEPLLTLVPTGQTPKIRALFSAADRDRINVGKEVRLDFTTLGNANDQISYQGQITQISADLSQKFERQGYAVEIEFIEDSKIDLGPMYPGIPVEVVLAIEGETVLSQLIAPIKDARRRVFTE